MGCSFTTTRLPDGRYKHTAACGVKAITTTPHYWRECGCGAVQSEVTTRERLVSPGLGDVAAAALATVGITEARVTEWLGRPCNCAERREKLNRLGRWLVRIAKGESVTAEMEQELTAGQ